MRLTTFLIALLLCVHSFKADAKVNKGVWLRDAMRATITGVEGISGKAMSLLATPLVMFAMCANFYACDQVQRVLTPVASQLDTSMQREETRSHIWVVDQNGIEMPVVGTWELVAQTNPNSPSTLGDRFTLPPELPHKNLLSEGTYTDDTGIPWTKVNIVTADDVHLMFLERIDTNAAPHQLHIVWKITDDHQLLPAYGEYPFEASEHDVQIWEKQ